MNTTAPLQFDSTCATCKTPFCDRVAVMNMALDYTDTMFCLSCLAKRFHKDANTIRERTLKYIARRDCFRKAWSESTEQAQACLNERGKRCTCQFTLPPQPTE